MQHTFVLKSFEHSNYNSISLRNASVSIEVKYPQVTITGFLSISTAIFLFSHTFSKKNSLKSDMHDCTHAKCQSKLNYIRVQSQKL